MDRTPSGSRETRVGRVDGHEVRGVDVGEEQRKRGGHGGDKIASRRREEGRHGGAVRATCTIGEESGRCQRGVAGARGVGGLRRKRYAGADRVVGHARRRSGG